MKYLKKYWLPVALLVAAVVWTTAGLSRVNSLKQEVDEKSQKADEQMAQAQEMLENATRIDATSLILSDEELYAVDLLNWTDEDGQECIMYCYLTSVNRMDFWDEWHDSSWNIYKYESGATAILEHTIPSYDEVGEQIFYRPYETGTGEQRVATHQWRKIGDMLLQVERFYESVPLDYSWSEDSFQIEQYVRRNRSMEFKIDGLRVGIPADSAVEVAYADDVVLRPSPEPETKCCGCTGCCCEVCACTPAEE